MLRTLNSKSEGVSGVQLARVVLAMGVIALSWICHAEVLLLHAGQQHPDEERYLLEAAEFYGVTTRVVEIRPGTSLRAVVRSDRSRVLAVAASADALEMLNAEDLSAELQRAIGSKVTLLIYGVKDGQGEWLKRWFHGVIEECADLPGSDAPEILRVTTDKALTKALAGSEFPAVVLPACNLTLVPGGAEVVVSVIDQKSESRPRAELVRWRTNGEEIFVIPELRESTAASTATSAQLPEAFARVLPYFVFLSHAVGEYGWHTDGRYANLTIDDAWLRQPYGPLDYRGLLAEMHTHRFHTTIAFVPWNFDRSRADAVELFRKNPKFLSVAIHGNNHIHREFGEYKTNPLEGQISDVRQGIVRMERFHALTGVSYDRFMIFPHGVAPAPTLSVLKEYGFLGTANASKVPLGSGLPQDPFFTFRSYSTEYGEFLSFSRYPAAAGLSRQEIAIQSFLGNPLLFYSHADFFFPSIRAFDGIADVVNKMEPMIQWTSLGNIARHTYLLRKRLEGGIDVLMLSSEMDLENRTGREEVFYIHNVGCAMQRCSLKSQDSALVDSMGDATRIAIPAHSIRRIQLVTQNDLDLQREDISKHGVRVYALRMLSDFRDIYLMNSSWGNAVIRIYYGHKWNMVEESFDRHWIWLLMICAGASALAIGVTWIMTRLARNGRT